MAAMDTQSAAVALLRSSFTGNMNVFSKKKNVVVQATQGCNGRLTVRASRGIFVPVLHRFLYEGFEKKGLDVWNTTYYPKAEKHQNLEKYKGDAAHKIISV